MSLFLFLTVLQAIVGAALVGVILMQRSEGGGLGVGGSPSGLMSARGAADFLSRATGILAFVFVALSIALAAVAVEQSTGSGIDTSLDRSVDPINDPLGDPLSNSAPIPMGGVDPGTAPAGDDGDPLAGAAGE